MFHKEKSEMNRTLPFLVTVPRSMALRTVHINSAVIRVQGITALNLAGLCSHIPFAAFINLGLCMSFPLFLAQIFDHLLLSINRCTHSKINWQKITSAI